MYAVNLARHEPLLEMHEYVPEAVIAPAAGLASLQHFKKWLVPRDYSQRTPKKMIKAALFGALSDSARNERIHVIEELVPHQPWF